MTQAELTDVKSLKKMSATKTEDALTPKQGQKTNRGFVECECFQNVLLHPETKRKILV